MRSVAFWLSAAVLFTFPTEDMLKVSDSIGSVSRCVGMLVTLFWILTILVTDRVRQLGTVHLIVAAFVLWNALSFSWTADFARTHARVETYFRMFVLFYILWDLYTTPIALRTALQSYVFGTYVALASQFYNFANGVTGVEFSRGRYTADGISPNSIGLILALSIPIAWYLAITSSESTTRGRLLRILNYAYIPTAYFSILLTASRGSLIASVPAVMFILGTLSVRLTLGHSLVLILVLLILCGLFQFVPPECLMRLSTAGDEIASGDLNGRIDIWQAGLVSFVEHPFIGAGANAFPSVNALGRAPHNTFMSILVDLGLIGLTLFVAIVALLVLQASRTGPIECCFWFTLLFIWFLGTLCHNWEHTKHTWLIISLVTAGANPSPTSSVDSTDKVAQTPRHSIA